MTTVSETPQKAMVISRRLRESIRLHLESIYPEKDSRALTRQVLEAYWGDGVVPRKRGRVAGNNMWSADNAYVITYGN